MTRSTLPQKERQQHSRQDDRKMTVHIQQWKQDCIQHNTGLGIGGEDVSFLKRQQQQQQQQQGGKRYILKM